MRTVLALAAALLLPATGAAQPMLSLRLAYAPAAGSAAERIPMRDALGAQIPVQVDALWSIGAFAAGPYLSWGRGVVSGCEDGVRCRGKDVRIGIEALHALEGLRWRELVPWAGAGVGWEWASRRRERVESDLTWTWSGPEAHLQLGGQWTVGRGFTVGPYVLVAGGRFGKVALYTPVDSGTAAVRERSTHAWVHLGVRGTADVY